MYTDIVTRSRSDFNTGYIIMKNGMWNVISIVAALLLCTSCHKSPNSPPESLDPDGDWNLAVTPNEQLGLDSMNIFLDIQSDNTYLLKLEDGTGKTLFSSSGQWNSTNDSIFLLGEECMILDTLPDPDTLSQLTDSICGMPVALQLPKSDDEWNITTRSLSAMLSAIPMKPEYREMVYALLPTITLSKTD